MSSIEIRLCKTWEECLQCEHVQQIVWGMPNSSDTVPAHFLITAIKNGGLLVGAFEKNEMIGFAFGFLGSEGQGAARRLKHTSHMLGVLPTARAKGLGAALKWQQRAEALKQGLDLMTWTYDPLQAVNAQLNLSRLGTIARRYIRDAYGEMTDALNAGIASDRFEVEWYLASPRVAARETEAQPHQAKLLADAQFIYHVEWDAGSFPIIIEERDLAGDVLLIEIPADTNALKAHNLDLAKQWRERTRSTFERAFQNGYIASDVHRTTDEQGHIRVFYLLNRTIQDPSGLQRPEGS
ncbi:MAG TPA: hypothetical protein VFD70_30635 [Anaerolineae bacterium]|nr:hypothetical protein [Anaerolineae bacterium]